MLRAIQGNPEPHQEPLPPRRFPQQHRAEAINGGHHCDPRDQWIGDHDANAAIAIDAEDRLLVENVPGPPCRAEPRSRNRIEEIVRCNDRDTHGCQPASG